MNLLGPNPFLGWNAVFKGAINHVAMAVDVVTAGAHKTSNLHYRIAGNGLIWHEALIKGDLAAYTTSNGGPGAFECFGIVRFDGAWYAHGAIWTSSTANTGAIFRTTDGRTWDLVTVPYGSDGPSTAASLREYRFAAANDDYIVALKPTGEFVYSSNGTSWSGRDDLIGYDGGFGPVDVARGLAATSGGITVVGRVNASTGQRFKTASTPSGTFTDRGAFVADRNITAFAQGNIVLAISAPSAPLQRSAYAAAGNLATWADAGLTETSTVNKAFFALDHWYAGSDDDWLVSEGSSGTPGVGGWTPVAVPWDGEDVTIGYEYDDRAYVHFGNGQLAYSDDGEAWAEAVAPNLAAKPYFAAAA
ncbi:hypothetical protein [Mesorhizobium sp. CAU 1741]|uniref:hypothetical protein n=1 Tax=Mesorhizobium sp. CAU 1741 TaxID=3140366 RepID=UPI00325B047E